MENSTLLRQILRLPLSILSCPCSHLQFLEVVLGRPIVLDLFRQPVVDFPKCSPEVWKTAGFHADAGVFR